MKPTIININGREYPVENLRFKILKSLQSTPYNSHLDTVEKVTKCIQQLGCNHCDVTYSYSQTYVTRSKKKFHTIQTITCKHCGLKISETKYDGKITTME